MVIGLGRWVVYGYVGEYINVVGRVNIVKSFSYEKGEWVGRYL